MRLAPALPCPPGAAAETPAAAGARFTSWKTEALAAVTRVVHEAAGATSVSAAMSADEAPAQRAAPACTPSPIAPEIVHLEEAFKAASTAAAAAASLQQGPDPAVMEAINRGNAVVFLDVVLGGGNPLGRIKLELFVKDVSDE